MNKKYSEKINIKDFEAKQNAIGFFSVLLKVAKRNPEIWKQICNENNENNRGSNSADKTK